jgi:uncharacterized sodium:solute symporter family permease YidK
VDSPFFGPPVLFGAGITNYNGRLNSASTMIATKPESDVVAD